MDQQAFAKWLSSLSQPLRICALVFIYSDLTVATRQMFLPEWTIGTERCQRVLEILHGLNEIHHTLSNQLGAYAADKKDHFPVEVFSEILFQIEKKYRLEHFLTPALEFVQTRKFWETACQGE